MVDVLKGLTEAQRRELHTKLAYEFREEKLRQVGPDETILWKVLGEFLPAIRHLQPQGFIAKYGVNKFQAHSAYLRELVAQAGPTLTRRVQKEALRTLMMQCLVSYVRSKGIPITAKTLLGNFDKLEYAVDRDFPGYIAAGVLGRVTIPQDQQVAA